MAEITRDTALEQAMLAAVIADRNDQPRNKQMLVGPSAIGFCRELLRASLFEGDISAAKQQETHWAAAAHVGSVMGADLERIFGQRLGALEQQRITAVLEKLGVSISGAMDLVFLDGNQVTDLKSTTDIGGILYDLGKNATAIETLLEIFHAGELYQHSIETPDGGYELTARMVDAMSKLQYYVQIAIYVTGAKQAGILEEGAEGRLVFYDRAGDYQDFVALVVSAEEIELFFEIAQHRVSQVVAAQDFMDKGADLGQMQKVFSLRDQTPSFCFSPKVMCPLRERCWGGSEYEPVEILESADVASSVDRYIEGRRLEKMGKGMKDAARDELKGISGKLGDGRMVSWVRGGSTINVVETAAPTGGAQDTGASHASVPESAPGERIVPPAGQTPSEGAAGPQPVPGDVPQTPQAAPSEGPEPPQWLDEAAYFERTGELYPPDEAPHLTPEGELTEQGKYRQSGGTGEGPQSPSRYVSAVERELAAADAEHVAHLQGLVDGALGKPSEERDPRIDRVHFVDSESPEAAARRERLNQQMRDVAEQRRQRGAR
jgi:hypothetical protein